MTRLLAGAAALVTLAVGVTWGTNIVGGSDSYCYVSQAGFWLTGALFEPQPIGFTAPWPNATATLTPTGYIESPVIPGGIAPLCPAGLSLTMAPFQAIGGPSWAFLVVPLLGALAVWLAYRLGRELSGPATGLLAAVLLAASPIFIRQLLQPMSDVPATAWWLASLVLVARRGDGRAFAAGLAASAAVLTRPNLAPLTAIVGISLLVRPRAHADESRIRSVALFGLGVLPGAILVAWIQQTLYGTPFSSGYGPLDRLFAWSHVAPNLWRYPARLLATHTPLVCLGLVAPFVYRWRAKRGDEPDRARHSAWLGFLCLAFAFGVFASYIAYMPYEEWWYLRFLLPAIPPVLVLTATALTALVSTLPVPARAPAGVLAAGAMSLFFLQAATARDVFRMREFEGRFRDAGQYVAEKLPPRAVVLTRWEGGSVRYYSGRLTVMFDELDPRWLDRALAFLDAQGRPPYLLLEASEEQAFRARFEAHSRFGALDWPPMAEIGTEVRLYNPADRARYYAGALTPTERVWPGGRVRAWR